MAHEILVNPKVEIYSQGQAFGTATAAEDLADGGGNAWRDFSEHVVSCGLPTSQRDSVDLTGGSNTSKVFLLGRPTFMWTVTLMTDFDANEVDATLRPLAYGGLQIGCRVTRLQAAVSPTNPRYAFYALLTNYAGFDEVELDARLQVALNFQVNGNVNVATA